MNKKFRVVAFLWIFGACAALLAQTNPTVRYVYDEAGNLISSVDDRGNVVIYEFDAMGNLVAVERFTARPVDIFFIIPSREDVGVPPGTPITIHGVGFSADPAENRVTFFDDVPALVSESSAFMIRTQVPTGARTGPVRVSSPRGEATSRNPFKVNSCINPPTGLVSWWTGDGHARDSVGPHPGAGREAATFARGLVSHAFSLEGSPGFVSIAHRPSLDFGAANFTLGFWMRTSAAGPRAVLNKREACASARGFWDIRLTLNGYLEAELSGDGSSVYALISPKPLNDGNWHYLALVRQGIMAHLYIDGELSRSLDTKEILNINNTAPMLIGNDACVGKDGTQFYQGVIDEVQWFNRALSSAEVQNIFNTRDVGHCRP